MGFLSNFLGAGAAHAYNEMKKDGRETQNWNELFHEMMECESIFNDYLKSVGIVDSYCADVEYVNNGNITPIKREINTIRKRVDDYLALGGLGVCVRNLGSLEDDIEKVKYLNKIGQLERQIEFAYDDIHTVQKKIETEQKEVQDQQYHIGIERVLDERTRILFNENWNKFEEYCHTFDACLEDLVHIANLREKINVFDTIISGFKLYEAYLMASKMPYELQTIMFKKIIDIMNIGKYELDKAEEIYSAILINNDGFRNHIELAVLPSEEYAAGMFWTYLLVASNEITDYSYIKNLLNCHVDYLVALGLSVQCFVDNDILNDVTVNYCGTIHDLLKEYIEDRTF